MNREVWLEYRAGRKIDNTARVLSKNRCHKLIISAGLLATCAQATASTCSNATYASGLYTLDVVQNSVCSLSNSDALLVSANGQIAITASGVSVAQAHGAVDMFSTNAGTITNYGILQASGAFATGIKVYTPGASTGAITNYGQISGFGSITSFSSGVYIDNTTVKGSITNAASGAISGNNGIYIGMGSVEGAIINAGTISGTGYGIFIDSANRLDGISNQSTGTIQGANGIYINNIATNFGPITNDGLIIGTTRSVDFSFAGNPLTLNNTGTLQGDADVGPAALNINGNHSRIIGTVQGIGSIVNVNGAFTTEGNFSVGTFNINSGGSLQLAHSISATNGIVNAGTIQVAPSTVQLMNGSYQQTAVGVYATNLADLTNGYGKLFINGNVTFSSGASLRVNKLAGVSLSNGVVLQSVISATGSWTGPLPTVVDNSYLFNYVAERTRDPAAMDLRVVVGNTVEDAVRSNGNNPSIPLAKVLDGYVSSTPPNQSMQKVIDALDSLGSAREVSNAVAQMQPLFFGTTTDIIHDATRIALDSALNRCDAVDGPSATVTTEASKCTWITPFGTTGSQSVRNGALGVHRNSSGLRGGLEGDVNGSFRAGLTFAGLDSQIASDDSRALQSASIASYLVGGFGDWQLGDGAHVVVSGAVNYNEIRGRRNFDFGGLSGFADSKFDGWAYHLSTAIAKEWNLSNQTSLKITDGVRYSEWATSGYRESGATVLNLAVSEQKRSALILSANFEVEHQLDEQWKIVSMLGAQVDALNRGVDSHAKFTQGDGFSTAAATPSVKTLQAGFGLQLRQSKSTRVAAQYFLESRESGYLNQGLSLDINVQY